MQSKWKYSFLIGLSFLLCSCKIQYRHNVEGKGVSPTWKMGMGGFIRYSGYNNSKGSVAGDMEVAMADYQKPKSNVKIRMVGVVHIADHDYYQEIQKILDQSNLVLYEGVRFGGNPGDVDPSSKMTYGMIGRILGLSGQLESINYRRKHWKQCDWMTDVMAVQRKSLNAEQVMKMSMALQGIRQLKKKLKTMLPIQKMEDSLKHQYALSLSKTKNVDFKSLSRNIAQWQRMLKNFERQFPRNPFLRELGRKLETLKKTLQNLGKMIIVKRNIYVIKKLKEELGKIGNPKKTYTLSIFYGAGHLKDFEERLGKMGYKRTKLYWLKAWKMDSRGFNVWTTPRPTKTSNANTGKKAEGTKVIKPIIASPSSKIASLFAQYRKVKWGKPKWAIEKKLKKLGSKAVPYLIKTLKSKDYRMRADGGRTLGMIQASPEKSIPALLKSLQSDPKPYVRQVVAMSLGRFKIQDSKTIQALLQCFLKDKNSGVQNNLTFVLAKMGMKVYPTLLPLLHQKSSRMRFYATQTMGMMKDKAKMGSALPYFFKNLDHKNYTDKDKWYQKLTIKITMRALGSFGAKGAPAIPQLQKILQKSKNKFFIISILETFGNIGPSAESTIPILVSYFKKDKFYQKRCVIVFGQIGKKADIVLPLVMTYLAKSKSSWDKRIALQAIGSFGEKAGKSVPVLAKMLSGKNTWVKMDLLKTLGKIGPSAKMAVPAIKKLLKSKNYSVRWSAKRALKKIQGK